MPAKSPRKGGFRNVVSPEIGGCFQRDGTSIMRTLNNTEWGVGGTGACDPVINEVVRHSQEGRF